MCIRDSGNRVFSVMLYTVSRKRHCFRNMLSTLSSSRTKVFTAALPVNLQNDRVYAPSNAKKRDIAPERLLRCRTTFSSLMVSVAVSNWAALSCSSSSWGEVDSKYYREVLLKKQTLSVMRRIAGDTYAVPCLRPCSTCNCGWAADIARGRDLTHKNFKKI